jgi:hypothetical protein
LTGVDTVMEPYGFPYAWIGPVFRAIAGVPVYAIYTLRTEDASDQQHSPRVHCQACDAADTGEATR